MALDATVSGSEANSYVTLAVAQAYLTGRLQTDEWDVASEADQEAALLTACSRIEQEAFLACVSDVDQALQWPRVGLSDRNGRTIASTVIPIQIQNAQCEYALALLKDPSLLGGDLDAFEQVQLGSMSVTPRRSRSGSLPSQVRRLLAWFLEAGTGIPVIRG